jgi:hypothetical protein
MADVPGTRWATVPDTDGELTHTLAVLEEILLHLQPVEDQPAVAGLGPDELHALQRICMRLHAAEGSGGPELYAPNGTFNYPALFFFGLLNEDLAAVGRAIAQLGASLLPAGDEFVREVINEFNELAPKTKAQDLIVQFTQAHGILDLAPDDDTRLLSDTLVKETGRVVFTPEQDGAYTRFTDRALAMSLDDPLQRFLYRGL